MLADDLLEDARHLAAKGEAEKRRSCMRRAISTAYYAVFHLLIEDFVAHWEFEDQRARLARMFSHQKMREAAFTPKDKKNPRRLRLPSWMSRQRSDSFRRIATGRTTIWDGTWWRLTCRRDYASGEDVREMAVHSIRRRRAASSAVDVRRKDRRIEGQFGLLTRLV
jgi:hypothetical protein